jgi:chromosome segregation ATPase
MIRSIILLSCVLLASCATKPAPASIIPAAPPRAAAVAPEAGKLRDQISNAGEISAIIGSGAKEARLAATKAREDAERLKARKTANEAELTRLWQDLQNVEERNLFLEMETSRLAASLTDARATAGRFQEQASMKDAEADQLRAAHIHLSTMAADHATRLTAATKSIETQRTRADKLSGEIRIYRIALGICLAIALSWIAAKTILKI